MSLNDAFSKEVQAKHEAQLKYLATGNTESVTDLRKIAIMLLTEAIGKEVENEGGDADAPDFTQVRKTFFSPTGEMTDTFMDAVEHYGVDIEPELLACELRAIEIVENINANSKNFTFADMWKISPNNALSEILRALTHGVSFWDNYDPEDFGLAEIPKIGDFDSCYDEAHIVCIKFAAHLQE